MTHDRNAGRKDTLHALKDFLAAFHLDGIGTSFLHDTDGAGKGLLGVALIGTEGHINHHKCTFDGADHRGSINNHFIKRDGESCLVTLHDVGSGIADEYNIDSGTFKKGGHGVVVSGEHGNFLAMKLHILKYTRGNFGDICL